MYTYSLVSSIYSNYAVGAFINSSCICCSPSLVEMHNPIYSIKLLFLLYTNQSFYRDRNYSVELEPASGVNLIVAK